MAKIYTACFFCGESLRAISDKVIPQLIKHTQLQAFAACTPDELTAKAQGRQVDILIPFVTQPDYVSAIMRSNPIQWVHSFSVGVDRFLVPEIIHTDIPFSNARTSYNASLQEYALTAILHLEKQIGRMAACKAAKTWDMFTMSRVRGKRLGVLGYGSIGVDVAKAAKFGLGMEIVAIKRTDTGPVEVADEVHLSSELHSVLPTLDYLVMILPCTPETNDIIGEAEIRLMKPSASIINIGRGNSVDEVALSNALKDGRLKGAALDVYKVEPLPKDHFLWETPNLLMSFHNADFTEDFTSLSVEVFFKNFERFLSGQPLYTPVNKQAGY